MTPFEAAIKALGDTPESVSAKLREMGIKGYRCSASSCPIANYLKACGFPHVTVANHASRYANSDSHEANESIILPTSVRLWVMNFDDRKYPEFYQE